MSASQVVVYSMSTVVCLLMGKKIDIIAIILNVIDFEKVTNVKVSHSYYFFELLVFNFKVFYVRKGRKMEYKLAYFCCL